MLKRIEYTPAFLFVNEKRCFFTVYILDNLFWVNFQICLPVGHWEKKDLENVLGESRNSEA